MAIVTRDFEDGRWVYDTDQDFLGVEPGLGDWHHNLPDVTGWSLGSPYELMAMARWLANLARAREATHGH